MLYPKGQGKAFSLNVGCLEIKIKFGFHQRQHKPLFEMNHSPQIHMENFLGHFVTCIGIMIRKQRQLKRCKTKQFAMLSNKMHKENYIIELEQTN